MKYSMRSLAVFVTMAGISPLLLAWLANLRFEYLLVPFMIIIVISISISMREFGQDGRSDPPNFS